MATKENKGGLLRNSQVDKDLEAKSKPVTNTAYSGSQDTGDTGVRQLGTEVQQRDGKPEEGENVED